MHDVVMRGAAFADATAFRRVAADLRLYDGNSALTARAEIERRQKVVALHPR